MLNIWLKKNVSYIRLWSSRFGTSVLLTVFLTVFLHAAAAAACHLSLQEGIAGEVLRFHVLANSDSEEDQAVKYQVRDAVIAWLSEAMEEQEKTGPENGKQETMEFLEENLREAEKVADAILREAGVTYRASASLERTYFPDRTYGEYTFPAGWYEALRLCLGEAKGQNWWCVLYPRLCFRDSLHAVTEEGEKEELEEVLTAEEYDELLQSPGKWKIAFRWF